MIRLRFLLQANQSVFIMQDVEKISSIVECIRLTVAKLKGGRFGRKKSTFICTKVEMRLFIFGIILYS